MFSNLTNSKKTRLQKKDISKGVDQLDYKIEKVMTKLENTGKPIVKSDKVIYNCMPDFGSLLQGGSDDSNVLTSRNEQTDFQKMPMADKENTEVSPVKLYQQISANNFERSANIEQMGPSVFI